MKTKTYIINLKYGIWENQLWLVGEDSPEWEKKWDDAKAGLDELADNSRGSGEFFTKAIEHFGSYGFTRIQK
ncbi:MAG: hypothetical protein J1E39_01425 [Eubacterium sp.]|nr:hypothetical protein [Eubacterium sp.]